MPGVTTLDIFAGPGGWDEALAQLGVPDAIGIETDPWACATAEAAGHKRLRADVSMVDLRDFSGVVGLVGSPPCPSFSTAGKGLGKLDMARILAHIERIRCTGRWLHYSREGWHDPRSALVLEPLRYALHHLPEWIALEQVPSVLPIWQAMAEVLRDHGYHVECGLLHAEQFAVAQTRKRAILTARRCLPRCAQLGPSACARSRGLLPSPTHRKYRMGLAQHEGDPALLPWVSMANALGQLGESFAMSKRRGAGMTARHGPRPDREGNEPSFTIVTGDGEGGGTGHLPLIIPRGQARNSGPGAQRDPRGLDEPSYTVRANGSRSHPSGVEWIYERPATTVQGDARIWPPGHKVNADDQRRLGEAEANARYGDRRGSQAVRVSVQEATVLQSFRPDYPWQGSRTAQYQQVGNAIPVLLAHAVLRNLIDP